MHTRWLAAMVAGATFLALAGPMAAARADQTSPGEVPATAPAPSQAGTPILPVTQLEAQMLDQINVERAAAGVGPVVTQSWSQSTAEQHSQAMAAAGDIFHNMTGYMDVARGILGATALGENVGMDSTLVAVDALLFADPPHKAITLDARYNTVGVGIAYDAKNWVYLTEDFAAIPGAGAGTVTRAAAPVVIKAPVVKAAVVAKPVVPKVVPTPAAPTPAPVAPAPAAPAPAPVVTQPVVPSPAAPAPSPTHLAARPVAATSPFRPATAIGLALLCLMALVGASVLGRRLSAPAPASRSSAPASRWSPPRR